MEPASPLLSAGLMMVSLLGAARLSAGEGWDCPCPKIPPFHRTKEPPGKCYKINETFRYTCSDGFVRKAGTSNRIRCELKNEVGQWEDPKLECIDDPKKPKPRTTTQSIAPKKHTDIPQSTTTTSTTTLSTSVYMNQSTISQDGRRRDDVSEMPHDAVTPTTVKSWEVEESTLSHHVSNNHTDPSPQALSGTQTAAIVSPLLLVVVCALTGIGFTLYRRKSRNNISQQPAEELEPMNGLCELPA